MPRLLNIWADHVCLFYHPQSTLTAVQTHVRMELVVRRLELVPSIASVPGRIMDRDVKVSVMRFITTFSDQPKIVFNKTFTTFYKKWNAKAIWSTEGAPIDPPPLFSTALLHFHWRAFWEFILNLFLSDENKADICDISASSVGMATPISSRNSGYSTHWCEVCPAQRSVSKHSEQSWFKFEA